MSGRRARAGFTLVETMVAASIFLLVCGGVATLFLGVRSMTSRTLAVAELSLRMRNLRERLLFHAAPPHDDTVWSGLLSGTRVDGNGSLLPVVENDMKILMNEAYGYSSAAQGPVPQRIELLLRDQSAGTETMRWLVNDGDRTDDRSPNKWLRPGGSSNLPATGWVDGTRLEASAATGGAAENLLIVNLEMLPNDPRLVRVAPRRERLVVPVFGKVANPTAPVFGKAVGL